MQAVLSVKLAQERYAEDLQGVSARRVHDARTMSSTLTSWHFIKALAVDLDRLSRSHRTREFVPVREYSMSRSCDPQASCISRRGFCLCCMAATTLALQRKASRPDEAYAEARDIVDIIRDDAAKTPIKVHRLRGNVNILEGSGGQHRCHDRIRRQGVH